MNKMGELKRMNNNKINNILKECIKTGGATLTKELENANIREGYMVSIKKFEYKTNINNIEGITKDIKNKIEYINGLTKNNIFIGLWIDDNILYIDISKNIKRKSDAIRLARHEDQKAIYDIINQKSIYTQKVYNKYNYNYFTIYQYNPKNNDIKYIFEVENVKEALEFLNITPHTLYDNLIKSVDEVTPSKLINYKYIVISE